MITLTASVRGFVQNYSELNGTIVKLTKPKLQPSGLSVMIVVNSLLRSIAGPTLCCCSHIYIMMF